MIETKEQVQTKVLKAGINPFEITASNCVFCNPIKEGPK